MVACSACTVTEPRPAPVKRSAEAVAPPAPKPVRTENLDDRAKSESETVDEEVQIAAVAAPDPAEILTSIGPGTPPERATSLRLIDEGRRLLEGGDDAAALDRIESAVKIDPSNPHGYYWLAQAHLRRGRFDQALAFAQKASVLFGPSERVWLVQTYTFQASVLERAGRFPEARESYRKAVDLEPGSVAARAGLARLGGAPPSAQP
jgi:Flp pilus assembly protein TadD